MSLIQPKNQPLFSEMEFTCSHTLSPRGCRSPSSEDSRHSEHSPKEQDSDYSDAEPDTFHGIPETELSENGKSRKKVMANPKPRTNTCVPKKKNKSCEFCGTTDTPMWRRGPQGKGTLCNACGVKWSLKFRKNSGKEKVATSSSKTPKKTKRETPYTKNDEPRKRYFEEEDSTTSDSVSDNDGPESAGNRLFGSLLNVVENKLVEAQELETIKTSLDKWRESVAVRDEQRQKTVTDIQLRVTNDLHEFGRQFTCLLAANEATVNTKLERVENEIQQISLQTNMMRIHLEEMKSLLKRELVSAFTVKIDGIETQMEDLRQKMETDCQHLRTQFNHGVSHLKGSVMLDLGTSEERVASELGRLKQLSQQDFFQLKRQLDRMDFLLDPQLERNL